jgi:hypothetical protein
MSLGLLRRVYRSLALVERREFLSLRRCLGNGDRLVSTRGGYMSTCYNHTLATTHHDDIKLLTVEIGVCASEVYT